MQWEGTNQPQLRRGASSWPLGRKGLWRENACVVTDYVHMDRAQLMVNASGGVSVDGAVRGPPVLGGTTWLSPGRPPSWLRAAGAYPWLPPPHPGGANAGEQLATESLSVMHIPSAPWVSYQPSPRTERCFGAQRSGVGQEEQMLETIFLHESQSLMHILEQRDASEH